MVRSVNPVLRKRQLLLKFRRRLSGQSMDKAKSDSHAKRWVRSCGLTVHPGKGCPFTCGYCYVPDLGSGFTHQKTSDLSGEELVFSLLNNPQFLPGSIGTFLAFGSVCDPFHSDCVEKTLEFMDSVSEYLGNPCQFYTKMYLSEEIACRLSELGGSSLSPLVSFSTWEQAEILEPRVPCPEERMESISNLRSAGLKPMLFLRPIIPGVTDQELDSILHKAKEAGAVGVVLGSLKVSRNIIARLKQLGLNLDPILKRSDLPQKRNKLVPTFMKDLKIRAVQTAERLGLIPFLSSCCANAYTAEVPCVSLCWTTHFCTQCPNNCLGKASYVNTEEVVRVVRLMLGTEPCKVELHNQKIVVSLPCGLNIQEVRKYRSPLQVMTRKKVQIRTSHKLGG